MLALPYRMRLSTRHHKNNTKTHTSAVEASPNRLGMPLCAPSTVSVALVSHAPPGFDAAVHRYNIDVVADIWFIIAIFYAGGHFDFWRDENQFWNLDDCMGVCRPDDALYNYDRKGHFTLAFAAVQITIAVQIAIAKSTALSSNTLACLCPI